jgi:hypothetical protein
VSPTSGPAPAQTDSTPAPTSAPIPPPTLLSIITLIATIAGPVGGVLVLFGLSVLLERRYSFLQNHFHSHLRFWGKGKGQVAPTAPVIPTGHRRPISPAPGVSALGWTPQ